MPRSVNWATVAARFRVGFELTAQTYTYKRGGSSQSVRANYMLAGVDLKYGYLTPAENSTFVQPIYRVTLAGDGGIFLGSAGAAVNDLITLPNVAGTGTLDYTVRRVIPDLRGASNVLLRTFLIVART